MADTGLLLAGDIRIGTVDSNGNLIGGMSDIINVPSLQITPPTINQVTRTSHKRDSFGSALDTVNLPGDPAQVQIQFDSLPAELLAEALGGTVQAFTQAEESTPITVTVTLVKNKWVPVGKRAISSVVVTDKEFDPQTVSTDKYEVDEAWGMIKAIHDDAAIEVDVAFKCDALEGKQINGATEINKPRRIELVGENLATGRKVFCTIDHANLSADQAIDLMQDDFVTGQLTGGLSVIGDKSAPYIVALID